MGDSTRKKPIRFRLFLTECISFLLYRAVSIITYIGYIPIYLTLTFYRGLKQIQVFIYGLQKPRKRSIKTSNTKSDKLTTGLSLYTSLYNTIKKLYIYIVSRIEKAVYPNGKRVLEVLRSMASMILDRLSSIGGILSKTFVGLIRLPSRLVRSLFGAKILFFGLAMMVLILVLFSWQSYEFVTSLPSPREIGTRNFALSTLVYDRNGEVLYEIYNDEDRTPIQLEEIPEYVGQASIAIEDKDFYEHAGISPIGGMLRAVKDTVLTGELQGGSTITQQLVKSSLLSPERTMDRKVKEVIIAIQTEQVYEKDEILEMYLNQVPYGGSAYGIEEAAKTFFGKSAQDLTLAEAAMLAGLPRAPSLYSPYVNPSLAKSRRNNVLTRMRDLGYISEKEYLDAVSELMVVLPPKVDIEAPHFVFYVRQKLEEQLGAKQVEEGGLRVQTTLDMELQKEVEKILKEEIAAVEYMNISNGAVLVTDPQTGEILAMAGSVDYFKQPFGAFNVTTALRQPGSSIKPIMYSMALENGYTAATTIEDRPLVIDIPGSEPYIPVNYDGRFHGTISLRQALSNSYNIPAVKVLQNLGVNSFIFHAERMGIDTWTDTSRFGLSLSLGGGEVTMTDMAEAFGVFASGGNLTELNGVLDITAPDGSDVEYIKPESRRVMDEGITYVMSDILSDNQSRAMAFGYGSKLEIPGARVAVKTGTTNDVKDNWTIGYTPNYLVTVWVGNNDSTPMNQYLVSGITGAAPIWNRVMTYLVEKELEENQEVAWYDIPENVLVKNCRGREEVFIAGTEDSVQCIIRRATPTAPVN